MTEAQMEEALDKMMCSLSSDGQVIHGTIIRDGKKESYHDGDIQDWVVSGYVSTTMAALNKNHKNVSVVTQDNCGSNSDKCATGHTVSSQSSSDGKKRMKLTQESRL